MEGGGETNRVPFPLCLLPAFNFQFPPLLVLSQSYIPKICFKPTLLSIIGTEFGKNDPRWSKHWVSTKFSNLVPDANDYVSCKSHILWPSYDIAAITNITLHI